MALSGCQSIAALTNTFIKNLCSGLFWNPLLIRELAYVSRTLCRSVAETRAASEYREFDSLRPAPERREHVRPNEG